MANYKSLTDLLINRKSEELKGITFILSDTEEHFVSYKNLFNISAGLLYNLQKIGVKKGDEVVFQIDDNQSFVYTFWACIMGGMIAVPISTGTNDEHKLKLFKIWKLLKNPKIIAATEFVEKLGTFAEKNSLSEQMNELRQRVVYVEDIISGDTHGEIYEANSKDIAFIQFSSGSTGDPKGVIVTHQNILINLSSVIDWVKIDSNDSGLNWMPLTHDMGLIGTHIKAILANINQFNIQTQTFIRHPTLWLQKASEHKVTILYSPNFGYKHLLKFISSETERDWDLSNIRLIFNGAEPISSELCNEFMSEMEQYGLKKNAMYPVYGLAEGTIAVTFPYPGEELMSLTLNRDYLKMGDSVVEVSKEDNKGVSFVDVGYPIYNCSIRICDENNVDIGENKIGYIEISGGNVTSGYYNNDTATRQAIQDGKWLNTGDLGFIKNKRLIITGRAKDVIFMAGQNFYSHDLERIAESVDGIELGKVAAIGVFDQKKKCDELVMFVLFKQKPRNFIPLAAALKKTISLKIGIEVSEVIPIRSIPKTTSGKTQRYKLRESYSKGEFDDVRFELTTLYEEEFKSRNIDLPKNPIEEELVRIWTDILNVVKIGTHDNFFELGGDSLRVTQLISRIRDAFSVEIEQMELFDNPEIEKLAVVVAKAETVIKENKDSINIEPNNSTNIPLSFAQQRLWFLDKLNGESSQYNLYNALRFQGNLNIDFLIKSLNEVIRRHKVLQASFWEENGQAIQTINEAMWVEIPLVDLTDFPLKERERKALNLAKEEASKSFNLEKDSLMRAKLFRIDENEHILLLAVHHIVFDGWSFGILLKELSFYYDEFSKGSGQCLPELDIQYTDFALWQAKKLQNGHNDKQLSYWKNQLCGKLEALDLPLDKQRPVVQTYNGAKFTSAIPAEIVKMLQGISKHENATLFMVLLAAYKVLLYRYTRQEEIIVGSPIANRNRKDIEGIIGFFTNNLVIKTDVSGEKSFLELLGKIKKVTLEAYSNQDVPFEKIVEELHVERDLSRNPLFQVLFSLQNVPMPEFSFPQVNISTIDIDISVARFDLSLDIRVQGDSLILDFEYNTDLFNADTIVRMAGHYQQLLKEIIENPSEKIDKYDLLAKDEKNTVIKKWNNTDIEFANVSSWYRLFEVQAEKVPDAIAVVGKDFSMTYGELNGLSNQLAHYLISMGVCKETIVGIYLDRSPLMLVGLLAVHKAGGAYLPMDPIFPGERLQYMLENSQTGIVLTEKALVATLPANNTKVVCIDLEMQNIRAHSKSNPESRTDSKSLAYIIYTSGSTGKPKGVQIEHHSLTNFLLSMSKDTGHTEKDTLLAVTTLSFDIAGLEMFMPLTVGAKIVLANREEVIDGERLIRMLNEFHVTVMQATPATWRLLLEAGWEGKNDLTILCGGEALPRELANKLVEKCACLWNVYGPTETTIWSTMYKVVSKTGTISIGKPIANTQVYVLDKMMNPVPVGIPGELYIGGDGVARGYLHQPELTNEKFIPDPFSKKKDSRVYKTGDMVKFMSDGNIEFVGRMDHQVKIRGFRIELGEIETILAQNNAVKECVVVAKELIPGESSLVAYIIAEDAGSSTVTPEDLRRHLKEKLPGYMVPSAFVVLGSFPMTPNGKIDRRTLPLPESLRPQMNTNYLAPSNNIEKTITKIWQEVLKLDRIGIHDNFFDLGGHSLLLAQVRSKIAKEINKEVSMMDLFKYPTVSTLTKFIENGESTKPIKSTEKRTENIKNGSTDIAVIGLSGRFPGAKNIEEFWNNISNGVESVSRFTDEQAEEAGVSPEMLKKPGYVKAWGVLEDIDKFDANFFGYNPREAEVLDPQQRIFLEEAWKALDNSGYDTERYLGLVGVYASVGMNSYIQNLYSSRKSDGLASDYQIMISNDKDFLATRIAYKLNLEGPGLTVQTACSSSLVAVHLACQSLNNYECDMALAGGVSVRLPQKKGYLYQEGMILSPDGHCRAFDEDAKGTVGGNGAGVVVLKRLEDAIVDGDDISAVIKGTAINNDGALKVGYTAPRIDGQAKVIEQARKKAGIAPETITYIEAHGTGTPLGDPIEIEALKKAFGSDTDKKHYCAVGSVKTNIGHLDSAAGVTGLIKTVLSLRNRKIPPSLNFKKPNSKIDFENSPFYVNHSLMEWKNDEVPLRAGVSSFGIGGTNAHVLLEEAPAIKSDVSHNGEYLILLSAKTDTALEKLTDNLLVLLKENENINMADVAFTLQLGRRELDRRRYLVCTSREDAVKILEKIDSQEKRIFSSIDKQKTTNVSFDESAIGTYSLKELGQMWLIGNKIDWSKLYEGSRRKRIALPSYPFEGKSFWVDKEETKEYENSADKALKQADISKWFYTPIWKQSTRDIYLYDAMDSIKQDGLLVLAEKNYFSEHLINRIQELAGNVIFAETGDSYRKLGNGKYIFNPDIREHYEEIIKDLSHEDKKPNRIVNMLGLTVEALNGDVKTGERLFYSLVYFAQAVGSNGWKIPLQIKILLNNSQKVFGEDILQPYKALSVGPCKVIPREYPNIKCCSIDMVLPELGRNEINEVTDQIIAELFSDIEDSLVVYRRKERFIQDIENVGLSGNSKSAVKLKNKGVYLIAGGIGGIGLVLAEYLAKEVKAKLVLISRSEFPQQQAWDEWLSSHGKHDRISRKIRKLKTFIALGAEVMVGSADITSKEQLEVVRDKALQTFGRIDGIIHAAGSPGGGMIQLKKQEAAQKVLKPKVQGTIELFNVFKDNKPGFFIVCSSLNAITGGFGQVDYSAANAFQDAFVQAHDSRSETRCISIDWDRWPGVGMASEVGSDFELKAEEIHPILGECVLNTGEKAMFLSEMRPEKDWVLSEHLVMGVPTIAGTTYLEMARAAFVEIEGEKPCEINEVLFLNPMAVKPGEKRYVFTTMLKSGNIYEFSIASKLKDAETDKLGWIEHARGKIAPAGDIRPKEIVLDDLFSRCSIKRIKVSEETAGGKEEFISFGKRWKSLSNFSLGENEGLVEVELANELLADLEQYKLHPALLDVATGSVRLAAGGNFLPFAYEKIIVKSCLTGKLYGHIRFKNGYNSSQEIITSDIDIIDEKGVQLAEIKNFSMKLIGHAAAANIKTGSSTVSRQSEFSGLDSVLKGTDKKGKSILNEGIQAEEGKEVFGRIIRGFTRQQVIVSTKEIHIAFKQANYVDQLSVGEKINNGKDAAKAMHPRPELENEYVAPKGEEEKKLAGIWENVLGIEKVGAQDEFFALGGDSLLLIQFHTKLKEVFETDIAVVDLYKYTTIASLAKYLSKDKEQEQQPVFEEVNQRANKQLEIMKQRRQQIVQRRGGGLK